MQQMPGEFKENQMEHFTFLEPGRNRWQLLISSDKSGVRCSDDCLP